MTVREVALTDAAELARVLRRNAEFLRPYNPELPPDHATAPGQKRAIQAALVRRGQRQTFAHAVVVEGRIVGVVVLSNAVYGPFCSANLGYWIDERSNGRGYATVAVRQVAQLAFESYGLHRIEAGVLPDNAASAKVLERNGFEQIGLSRRHLKIAGEWRDHVLYSLTAEAADA